KQEAERCILKAWYKGVSHFGSLPAYLFVFLKWFLPSGGGLTSYLGRLANWFDLALVVLASVLEVGKSAVVLWCVVFCLCWCVFVLWWCV
ncbi:hypothetical protein, partial [Hydrogenivirga sp. 128-5-R1-1]|uniref:hypothetical protein n=1 Tax=Hydrogenivirga sp. 128-5-R1-1 TaxID=392423 RepID=UPI00015F17D6